MKPNNNKCGGGRKLHRREFLSVTGTFAGYMFARPLQSSFLINKQFDKDNLPWRLIIDGDELIIPAGQYASEIMEFRVKRGASFKIKPSTIDNSVDEELFLSPDKPSGFWTGTPLSGPRYAQLGVYLSLIEESLVLKDCQGGLLTKEDDYLASAPFALVGLGTNTSLTRNTKVSASYSYYLQRIDSVFLDEYGVPFLQEGIPSLVSPSMPETPSGAVRFCNIYRPIQSNKLIEDHLLPIISDALHAVTETTSGKINRTLAKLRAGETVNIVSWGDSITAGADVKPGEGWADLLHVKLKEKFPQATINYTNHSIGGTRSMQWLYNGDFPGLPKLPASQCSFDLIANDHPDLVVMEFTNDTVLPDPGVLAPSYDLLRDKINAIGSELIICTPGRLLSGDYNSIISGMKVTDGRTYVSFVKTFAKQNNFAIADISARWDHFYKEGIPYPAILINAYNHPNAFGHTVFVEEQLKCFE